MTDTHTTSHIPDEAVQAAAKHSYEYEGDRKGILYVGWEYEGEEVREQWCLSVRQVIAAALPYLSSPCAVEVPTKEERHANTSRNLIINQTSTDLEQIINGHDPVHSILNNDVWDRLDKMACEIEALAQTIDVPALIKAVRNGERDGFINTGKEPHGNDADLSCPCCGGSGHKDDAKPVDVAAVLNSAALIVEGRSTAVNSDFIQKLSKRNVYEIATLVADHDIKLGAAIRALSAEPAQGDHIADVGKMVEALAQGGGE